MSQQQNQSKKSVQELAKIDKQARAQGLPSWMHLMAKQDPAMADIMAQMIKSEIDNKEPRPDCELCITK